MFDLHGAGGVDAASEAVHEEGLHRADGPVGREQC